MKVILVSAKAQHGKDSFAKIFKAEKEQKGEKVAIAHFADLVKYICTMFFDWDGAKDEYGRSLLQNVGTDVVRTKYPNYWVEFIGSIIELFPNEWDYMVIPDARFENEITYFQDNPNILTYSIRINRPDFDNGLTETQKHHASETSLDNFNFDFTLENTGLFDDYQNVIKDFINNSVI